MWTPLYSAGHITGIRGCRKPLRLEMWYAAMQVLVTCETYLVRPMAGKRHGLTRIERAGAVPASIGLSFKNFGLRRGIKPSHGSSTIRPKPRHDIRHRARVASWHRLRETWNFEIKMLRKVNQMKTCGP